MQPQETFTTDEILEILADVGVIVEKEELDSDDDGTFEIFNCECGPVQFQCYVDTDGPFHRMISLFAQNWTSENPYEFVNNLNADVFLARVVAPVNDDGTLDRDEDGDFVVKAVHFISFAGTVTPDHLKFLLSMWIEDLFTFFQIEPDEDETDDVPTIVAPSQSSVSLVDRLSQVLSKTTNRTARQLVRELGIPKNDINSTLYGSKELFKNDGDQPPKWSLR